MHLNSFGTILRTTFPITPIQTPTCSQWSMERHEPNLRDISWRYDIIKIRNDSIIA